MAVSDNQKLNNNAYVIKLQPEMAIFSTFNIIADLQWELRTRGQVLSKWGERERDRYRANIDFHCTEKLYEFNTQEIHKVENTTRNHWNK